ncbi:hypothetical protein BDZ45DRAFT_104530 [Acephala macrosclerotiorum]|nr:hypothetical protein BDZ45DRAFT_104530 [Acephala macrosclerotiorum]
MIPAEFSSKPQSRLLEYQKFHSSSFGDTRSSCRIHDRLAVVHMLSLRVRGDGILHGIGFARPSRLMPSSFYSR